MQSLYVMLILGMAMVAQSPKRAPAVSKDDCPLHAQHMAQQEKDKRFAETKERGNRSMGFDQEKTTHHFRSLADGGAIEVTVNDPNDAVNLLAIRKHLKTVAADFAKGDFSSPLATHAEMPAGADGMQRAMDKIAYRYEGLPNGARVRIVTNDPEALQAVRQFLGYQVTEHRTGDAEHKH